MAIYLALGANEAAHYQGKSIPQDQSFAHAIEYLQGQGVQTLQKSALWSSPAWPDPKAQNGYINAVIEVKTDHSALELLAILKKAEQEFGRVVGPRNAPRPLDLDILDYHGQQLTTKILNLPHPRMLERAFVLFPLSEIAPNWHDPKKNRAIQDWIARLPYQSVQPLKRLSRF